MKEKVYGQIDRAKRIKKHSRKTGSAFLILEATPGFEPGIKVLQTSALPLGYVALYLLKFHITALPARLMLAYVCLYTCASHLLFPYAGICGQKPAYGLDLG